MLQYAQQLWLTAEPWLPLARQWKESYVHDSVGAVCVHMCVHSCLNSGYCSTLVLHLVRTVI